MTLPVPPGSQAYDVLLDDYEKGMTAARLDEVFAQVRGWAGMGAGGALSAPNFRSYYHIKQINAATAELARKEGILFFDYSQVAEWWMPKQT